MKRFIFGLVCYLTLTLALAVALTVGCEKIDDSIDKVRFEVYLMEQAKEENEYLKSDAPLFTNKEIEKVYWDTQEYIFKSEFLEKLEKPLVLRKPDGEIYFDSFNDKNMKNGSRLLRTNGWDKFGVYIDGEFIYDGYFQQAPYSSFMPMGNTIYDQENGIFIAYGGAVDELGNKSDDKRKEQRIYKVLKELELLEETKIENDEAV